MKIFISHSTRDHHLVDALRSISASLGIEPFIAEHTLDLQNTVTQKIENMIEQSDLVLVALAREGFNSNFVQQEIGYARGKKPMLILVERGCENRVSGFIFGSDFILVDPWNLTDALSRIRIVLTSFKQRKEQQNAVGKLLLLGLAILFFSSK
ncbi:MAG: toll/interleukin-1 receptor domain-containing protein [Ignavibacteriae bacterium]|nr:toll/interleukin-1 receptor domain-containing protein [Ignavibacteria bacterium]MBI3363859.1 toll/interleukin-1 receptor domain-containing protein [Ignavibacteriota bacterium]